MDIIETSPDSSNTKRTYGTQLALPFQDLVERRPFPHGRPWHRFVWSPWDQWVVDQYVKMGRPRDLRSFVGRSRGLWGQPTA